MNIDSVLPGVFRGLDLLGVFLNGMLGGFVARGKHFDVVGFAIIAIMSALGGGMIRDVLLSAGPPVALTDPYYLGTALAGALLAFLLRLHGKWLRRTIVVADAVVLGAWAATGATKTLAAGFGIAPAVMLGVTTAVGGSMVRDVAVGQVPTVFGGNTLYATGALLSSCVYLGLHPFLIQNFSMLAATVSGALLCIAARWRKWVLPQHRDFQPRR